MDVVTLVMVVGLSIVVALAGTRVLIDLLFALMARGAMQQAAPVVAQQGSTASPRYS